LQVYEHGFAAVKVPKNIANGSSMLLMGFPDCGSSYFLLMLLDKDFKPLFKLLETQPDPSGKAQSFNDLNHVMRIKNIDIGQMQMLEDEMNLSLLDLGKLLSFLPGAGGPNQTSEHGILSDIILESSMQLAGCPPSSFSSVVDEVFELEKGSSVPPFSVQNLSSSYSSSPASHFGSAPMNLHSIKAGTPSPKWEGGMQMSQINNVAKVSSMATHYNGSLYSSSNLKGAVQSNSVGSLSSVTGRSASMKKLSASKSEQDLASLRSPHSVEAGSTTMDEDQLRLLNDTSKDSVYGSRSARLLSPPRVAGPRMSVPGAKPNGVRSSPTGPLAGSFRVAGSSPCTTTPVCKIPSPCLSTLSWDLNFFPPSSVLLFRYQCLTRNWPLFSPYTRICNLSKS
jgi:mediator of RNA polymerase II transcription subunit 14